jgi:hypothetical protein
MTAWDEIVAQPMSYALMEAGHLCLLELADERDLSADSAMRETMLRFLSEVAATGTLLKLADERRVAQGVLDYWVATLNAVPADAASAPEPISLRLARFDPAALEALTARAEEVAVITGAERTVIALFMGLLQPEDARRRLVRAERDREEWTAGCAEALGLDATQVAAVADQLVGAGLVIETTLPDRPGPVVELAARALIETWDPLARAVQTRLRLRENARLWEQEAEVGMSGAPGSGAPVDPLLTAPRGRLSGDRAAPAIPALDPLERRYQEHTIEIRRRSVRRVVLALCVLLAAAVGAIVALVWARNAESTARLDESKARLQAEDAKEKAELAASRARVEFQRAEDSRTDAERALAEEQRLRRRADEAIAVVRRLVEEGRLDRTLFTGILAELAPPASGGPSDPQRPIAPSPDPGGSPQMAVSAGARLAAEVQQLNAPELGVRRATAQRILTAVRDGGMSPDDQDRVIAALVDALGDERIRAWSANGRSNLILVLSEFPPAVWTRTSLRQTVVDLRQAINALKLRIERGETQAGANTLQYLANLESRLGDAPVSPATAISPLSVYAHIANPADRRVAEEIGRSLGAAFPLVGVEYIAAWGARPRTAGQVRFYRPDQRGAAQQLAERLRSETRVKSGRDFVFEIQDISRTFPNLPNDRIEVWFPQLQSEDRYFVAIFTTRNVGSADRFIAENQERVRTIRPDLTLRRSVPDNGQIGVGIDSAMSRKEADDLVTRLKALGFSDAYPQRVDLVAWATVSRRDE